MRKVIIRNDYEVEPKDFVDYDAMDFRFKRQSSRVKPIPFEEIGLYLDEYRTQMPDKQHYRMAVKEFFDGIPSHPGTKKQIDTAAIVESGPVIESGSGS